MSLGVRAIRTANGSDWCSTAIGLGMDVDNTPRAGASLFLHANGNVGIGTAAPAAKLQVTGGDLQVGDFGSKDKYMAVKVAGGSQNRVFFFFFL